MEEYNNVKTELTEEEARAAGWQWEKRSGSSNGDYANITGYIGSQSEIHIPSKIGNLDVPYEANIWYILQDSQNRENIKKIVVPGKNYDYLTFADWSGKLPNLETIILKEGMTELEGTYSTAEAKKVHTLVLPSTLRIIWNPYCLGYSYFSEVVIPKSVTKIPEYLFAFSKGGPITIYCEAESKPKDWSDKWLEGAPEGTKVIWGYQRANFGKTTGNNPTDTSEPTENYVGCYADLNGDGKIEVDKDGIIYADLAAGTTGYGRWNNNSNTKYDIPKKTEGLRNYTISEDNKSGPFGDAKMVSENGGMGTKRFYVMALSDFTENGPLYDWYYAGYSNGMRDYQTYTSKKFGTGENNTKKMIEKWNSEGYGNKNACPSGSKDLWGQIQTKYNEGWFVPSVEEFNAFGGELSITADKWEEYGLIKSETNSGGYWLSSQSDSKFVCLGSVSRLGKYRD